MDSLGLQGGGGGDIRVFHGLPDSHVQIRNHIVERADDAVHSQTDVGAAQFVAAAVNLEAGLAALLHLGHLVQGGAGVLDALDVVNFRQPDHLFHRHHPCQGNVVHNQGQAGGFCQVLIVAENLLVVVFEVEGRHAGNSRSAHLFRMAGQLNGGLGGHGAHMDDHGNLACHLIHHHFHLTHPLFGVHQERFTGGTGEIQSADGEGQQVVHQIPGALLVEIFLLVKHRQYCRNDTFEILDTTAHFNHPF